MNSTKYTGLDHVNVGVVHSVEADAVTSLLHVLNYHGTLEACVVSDLADRLLALAYCSLPVSLSVQDALYDFSREGSFAAMRELVRRFPMDDQERAYYMQVLRENGQEH